VNVIVTQPRRLAARALCNRVSSLLGEDPGGTCGYAVGNGERVAGPRTRLLFVTSGWLLTMLSHNPAEVRRYTHVIMDEAHERSADQDFLCLVLKRLLFARAGGTGGGPAAAAAAKVTRLVVMSATLQSSLFGEYFSTPGPGGVQSGRHEEEHEEEEEEPIFVGAGRFPVEIFYADDIAEGAMGVLDVKVKKLASQVAGAFDEGSAGSGASVKMPYGTANLIAALCNHVAVPGGCVLVFLPGISEIELAAEAVERCVMAQRGQGLGRVHSFPLHLNTSTPQHDCLLLHVVCQGTRTHSPQPPPWPGCSVSCQLNCQLSQLRLVVYCG